MLFVGRALKEKRLIPLLTNSPTFYLLPSPTYKIYLLPALRRVKIERPHFEAVLLEV